MHGTLLDPARLITVGERAHDMSAWLTRHVQTLIGSLGRLSQHKLATLLTTLVIGIALALPACLHLLIANAQAATGNWDRAVDISVYLQATDVRRGSRARSRSACGSGATSPPSNVITADEALKEFRRESGFGEAIDALTENPLPQLLIVRPQQRVRDRGASRRACSGSARLAVGRRGATRHSVGEPPQRHPRCPAARRAAGRRAARLGVMVIVGNTIRLDIQNRRHEIEVTKLVGGSDAFVRRPFLYSGVWYGVGGAPDCLGAHRRRRRRC